MPSVIHMTRRRLRLGARQGPYKTRKEILHQLRGIKEKSHRVAVLECFSRKPSRFRLRAGEQNPVSWSFGQTLQSRGWAVRHILDYHNKSTAIYLLDPQRQGSDLLNGIWKFVDIWLYRQWFKPYETDIEYGRYVGKSISLGWDTDTARPTLTDIAGFHTNLCQDLSADIFSRLPDDLLEVRGLSSPTNASEKWQDGKGDRLVALSRRYILQPLFKAVFIVLDQTMGPTEGPLTPNDIGDIPVSLVRTGCTEGLSSPISFDAIHHDQRVFLGFGNSDGTIDSVQTTLKAAIQFIIGLENREMAAFGMRPSPYLLDDSVDFEKEA
ncbi:uncharacterized protein NECHADRAFT_83239 [Fusarium vanettenii 77-13-4]|uniref:Uncharacterized protein n=1 Tax=Fusarium vanettenii (strain ATCC MYA-4622 / CBS 123669 / FGSC 9596 / NRRL 45880 / 77-13-4) TaxID=660122 RepID=C7Z3G3_FUSV7|nr:uncharacterized protein NECHADRAFT_83239 [Fusarium vanettenii 77-13-4]EEU41306.1 hypothetical protein NECHADRAFT_83239 [Fusarium vanettenii 77-13-4]